MAAVVSHSTAPLGAANAVRDASSMIGEERGGWVRKILDFCRRYIKSSLSQDVRELQAPVAIQLKRANATLALEAWSHSYLVRLTIIVYFNFLIIFLVTVIVVSLATWVGPSSLQQIQVMLILDGICRSLAVVLMVILLFWFPIELIRAAVQKKRPILPEQTLLLIPIIFINVTPSCSLYGLYMFWAQYVTAAQFTQATSMGPAQQAYTMRLAFFTLVEGTYAAKTVQSVLQIVDNAIFFLCFGTLIQLFGEPPSQFRAQIEPGRLSDDGSVHNRQLKLVIFACAYCIVGVTLVVAFDFVPNQVPLMGILTVFSVCALTPSCTSQYLKNGSNILAVSCPPVQGGSNCAPGYADNLPFSRSISVVVLFCFDLLRLIHELHIVC